MRARGAASTARAVPRRHAGRVGAQWRPIRPGTDTALMLALAHTLVRFRRTSPFLRAIAPASKLRTYVLGRDDETPKDAAGPRTSPAFPRPTSSTSPAIGRPPRLITVSHSLQRAEHGEQPVWMGAVLAAMLGQIGLPGGGYNYGRCARPYRPPANAVPIPTLSQGRRRPPTSSRSRVSPTCCSIRARSSSTTAGRCNIPTSSWSIGRRQPFHHHQDINRLRRAFNARKPSSCTRAPGRRWRSLPTSCCPRP